MVTAVGENPLRAGMQVQRTPEPCTMVIMGVTGDLAHRKLIPSLYNLEVEHLLPHGFAMVGFARTDRPDLDLREDMCASVDRFFLCVEARDPSFDPHHIRRILERHGAEHVAEVPA